MIHQVAYGTTTIAFSVRRSPRRTLAIEVHPDLSIQVVAPEESPIEHIRAKVFKRARWIIRQQRFFEEFLPRTPRREYVSGETHLYLGKKYLLKVRKAESVSVKLRGGELVVTVKNPLQTHEARSALGGWYFLHAQKRFEEVVTSAIQKFKRYNLPVPQLTIRRMSRRWGSCTSTGKIILNPEIIKAHGRCIEYVVIHELCHLVYPSHDPKFYRLQGRMMPDWEKWKGKLEKVMA